MVKANHPKGIEINIDYLTADQQPAVNASDDDLAMPTKTLPSHENKTFSCGSNFDIKAGLIATPYSAIDISFDSKFLKLENAQIDNNQIIRTLTMPEECKTDVVVTTYGGMANFAMD